MTFLKKFGAILLKFTEIFVGLAPMFEGSLPGQAGTIQVVSKDLTAIAQIVLNVETIGQALNQPGPQKLIAAAPLVAQVILQSSILANQSIANPELFQKGCGEIAGGMADILNSLKDDVDTQSKT